MQDDFDELGQEYGKKIDRLLQSLGIVEKVARYFDPDGRFAAISFDEIQPNKWDRFSDADFLAVAFLDTPIRASAYRRLLARRRSLEERLQRIPAGKCLWDMEQSDWDSANELWQDFVDVNGIGPTRASKLLARKRPHLLPILDSRVSAFFDHKTEQFWWPLALALKDTDRRERIERLRPATAPAGVISTIRLLDVAIWMSDERAPGTVTGDEE